MPNLPCQGEIPSRQRPAMSKTSSTTLASPNPAQAADYVLPKPARAAEVVVVHPNQGPGAGYRRGGQVARTFGDHFGLLAQTQSMFLAEVRERLQALDASIAEASKAQLKGAVRELLGIVDWCDTLQADLIADSSCAADGNEPVDLEALAEEIAVAERAAGREVRVRGSVPVRWWGDCALCADLLRAAIGLVAERTNGQGSLLVELSEAAGLPCLRVTGTADPHDGIEPATISRFRTLVELVGATVRPDALGPGGVGLEILLASSRS